MVLVKDERLLGVRLCNIVLLMILCSVGNALLLLYIDLLQVGLGVLAYQVLVEQELLRVDTFDNLLLGLALGARDFARSRP